ncbi:MAG TPA: hypothetical protein VGE52_18775, partial [Pirellulales bacterium]
MGKPFDPYYLWLGIPPAEQPPHHYRLLGLTLFESNVEVVSQAADRQMAFVQMHKTGRHSAESQRLLNELSSARLCLLNPAKKAAYDEALRKKLEPLPPASPVAAGASAASVFAPAVPVVPGSSGVNTSAEGAIPPAMPAPFVAPPGGVNPFAAAPIVGPASGAPANPFASGPMHVAPVNYGAAPGFGSAGPSGASPYAPASIARPIAVPPVAAPPADARESDSAFAAPFSVDTTGSHRRNKRLTPAKLGAIVGGVAALLAVVYAILSSSSDAPPAIVDRRDPAHPASNAGEASSSGEGAPQGEATGPNVRAAAAEATSGTRAPVAHVIAPPTGAPNGANTPRVRVAQPHVIGAADSSRDANATGGASGAPDTLESAPNGGLRWPPGYGWSFADFPLGDQRQTLIADADGFAGFAGIHGGMHGFGEHLGFERANGSWSMTGRGGQPGFGGSALTIKSPIRGFEFRQYGWTTGEAPVEMIPARDGFCLLTSVSGSFMGDGEWVKVDVNEAGNWRLY